MERVLRGAEPPACTPTGQGQLAGLGLNRSSKNARSIDRNVFEHRALRAQIVRQQTGSGSLDSTIVKVLADGTESARTLRRFEQVPRRLDHHMNHMVVADRPGTCRWTGVSLFLGAPTPSEGA